MTHIVFEKLNNLPVISLLDEISEHSLNGGISIINSETSSGKSLLVPLRIQRDTSESVFVLEPRRFLAINAAENLSEISNTILGEEFGYLIGHTGSGEENRYDRQKTTVCFASYGFALATKMVMEVDHIVLDEIHEHSIDMAICKALIQHRYKTGNPPKSLILMSASLDAEAELAYWNEIAPTKIFSTKGIQRFTCNKVHLPATDVHAAVLELIHEGYKGILVFASGVSEINDIANDLTTILNSIELSNIVVHKIHGQSDYNERHQALSPPEKDQVKVLIGTNVIETGMNLEWVDAGVTTGDKKELHVRPVSNAIVLSKVPLVKSNIDQQAGRTNRFRDSKFVICGSYDYDQMKATSTPEIDRLPLTALYMHCQSVDIDPEELCFLPQPNHSKMKEAVKTLQNLGFFDENRKLTKAGEFAQNLPVGLETAAMLYHAQTLDILKHVLILAAVNEVGSIRKEFRMDHGFNSDSDLVDEAFAYVQAIEIQSLYSKDKNKRHEKMEQINVGYKRFLDVQQIVKSLEQRFKIKACSEFYDCEQLKNDKIYKSLFQCILAASVCNMGVIKQGLRGSVFANSGERFSSYQISTGSVLVDSGHRQAPVSAKLRTITPKNGKPPFTVAEQVTLFSFELIDEFSKVKPGVFTTRKNLTEIAYCVNGMQYHSKMIEYPFEQKYDYAKPLRRITIEDSKPTLGDILTKAYEKNKINS